MGLGTVLVTDAEGGPATSIIRSLGRAGYLVVAGTSRSDAPGLRSRHAAHRLRYPSPGLRPEAFVSSIRQAVIDLGVDLVIPVSDASLLRLAHARHELGGTRLAAPANDALDIAISKRQTIKLAQRMRVPVPPTMVVRNAEAAVRAAGQIGYPVVLKPDRTYTFDATHGARRHGVGYADGPSSVMSWLSAGSGLPILVQTHVPGIGVGVELLAQDGEPVMAFQHRRLRELPVTGGASSMRESVALDPDLYRHASVLASALRWTGLMMVEFKLGADGPMLMEINGRPWGSLPLAVSCGADFPLALAQMMLGGSPPPAEVGDYRIGVRGRNLDLDLRWAINVALQRRVHPFLPFPARRLAVGPLIDLGRSSVRDDLLSVEDPMPGILHLLNVVRRLVRRIVR